MNQSERSSVAPTERAQRVQLLDALRGFALFGIILANIDYFTGGELIPDEQRAAQFGNAAAWNVEFAINWLAGGKFYTSFSLLFGISFAIQLQRIEARGQSMALYVRRLLILFLFGLANLILIWMVDILALYALMGFLLLLFRRTSDRMLLLWALLLWIVPILWIAAIVGLGFRPGAPFRDAAGAVFQYLNVQVPDGPLPVYVQGNYLLLVKLHLGEIFLRIGEFVGSMRPAKVLAMFLLGLWAGRRLIYVRLDEYAELLRRVAKWGFLIGLSSSGLSAWLDMTYQAPPAPMREVLRIAAACIGHPTLALAYMSTFALLWRTNMRVRLALLAPAGQMALTNYLLHALILLIVFFGVGFGLIGKLSNAWIPLMAIGLFSVQLIFSTVWLGWFKFGPAEWLWRTLTYGRRQPMLLIQSPRLAPAK